jgi:hypothetical protein
MSYYKTYYELKKHLYKERYLEQKRRKAWEQEIYKNYDGKERIIINRV